MDGVFTSYHTAEIPFVFNNIEKSDTTIGGGLEAQLLEDSMSQAWINFARTGDPNAEGLPHGEPYTREGGATMVFDDTVRLVHHHDARLMELLAGWHRHWSHRRWHATSSQSMARAMMMCPSGWAGSWRR